MSPSVSSPPMTAEEFLSIQDDALDQELINGQLRERGMTVRNFRHSAVLMKLGYYLQSWLQQQPLPRGKIIGGEAGVLLRRNPDTLVGIDLAYISDKLATAENRPWVEGVPLLAVEILSPSDKHEEVVEKVQLYLEVGIALVWIIDPEFRTVTVHRPDHEPEGLNIHQQLSGDVVLQGFEVVVAELFT